MKPRILCIRAISADYVYMFIRPIVIFTLGCSACLLLVIVSLAYLLSPWWLLAGVPVLLVVCVIGLSWLVLRIVISHVSPKLTEEQKTTTRQFVVKMQGIVENFQTPYIIIGFCVLRDILFNHKPGFIETLIQESKSLQPDYKRLENTF